METKPRAIRNALKNWLNNGAREDRCPFSPLILIEICPICRDVFPRCRSSHQFQSVAKYYKAVGNCPCHVYTHAYVVRKARQIVKGDIKCARKTRQKS